MISTKGFWIIVPDKYITYSQVKKHAVNAYSQPIWYQAEDQESCCPLTKKEQSGFLIVKVVHSCLLSLESLCNSALSQMSPLDIATAPLSRLAVALINTRELS